MLSMIVYLLLDLLYLCNAYVLEVCSDNIPNDVYISYIHVSCSEGYCKAITCMYYANLCIR